MKNFKKIILFSVLFSIFLLSFIFIKNKLVQEPKYIDSIELRNIC